MRRILLIEDDDDIRQALNDYLSEQCFSVVPARNGAEGLALLKSGYSPHGILVDFSMPGMNGMAFRSEQLRNPSFAEIPVVLMTARTDVLGHYDGRTLAAVVAKPFNAADLVATLERVIPSAA